MRRFILSLGQKKAKIKLSLISKCLNCICSTQEHVVQKVPKEIQTTMFVSPTVYAF